ncbi:MAG: type VI secretion system Vgr family protein [Marinibacterium sp.]
MPRTVNMLAFPMWIHGNFDEDLYLVAARVTEGFSQISKITMEFVCTRADLDLTELLGKPLRAAIRSEDGKIRAFPGSCVSIESAGRTGHLSHYVAEVRPWLWFLTRTRECRIFQEVSVVEIFDQIMDNYGFGGLVEKKLSNTYDSREYTVQYRETDLDFLSRLMEEAGIFYYFRVNDSGLVEMVLADDIGAYDVAEDASQIPFRAQGEAIAGLPHVFEWESGLAVTSGKVSLDDYDFEKPAVDIASNKAIPKGDHWFKNLEMYDYPGRYRDASTGDTRAKIRMEAEAVRHATIKGAANFTGLHVGHKFGVADLWDESESAPDAWLVTGATHQMRQAIEIGGVQNVGPRSDIVSTVGDDLYRVDFTAIPATEQFRAPLQTPWPEIPGVQTAFVVGAKGEEIHTDNYGRVKLHFHWDRKGRYNDTASCWVRVMSSWAGTNWGMVQLPRVGQEVVVQFEEGDPDRPLVVGMVYNAHSMPPYGLPDNKTQSGIKTNSSKGGGGFNELMMEDKAGAELVRFQSERDYKQIVKNNADITVGLEHKDKGDMSLEVHRHLTEKLNTGDHSFNVQAGKQTLNVRKDKTETIGGKSTKTVTGNVTETIKMGNYERTINVGSETHTLKMGSQTHNLKLGNFTRNLDVGSVKSELKLGGYTVKTGLGKQLFDSPLSGIELKCGANSIKIDMMGVTIKGLMVKVEGQIMTTVKGTITEVNGTGLAMVKGGVLLIN